MMAKRLLYPLASLLLLLVPWWGGPSVTLLVAFVPLLLLQRELASQRGPRGKPRRLWPSLVLTFSLWWLGAAYWVTYAAVIGIVAVIGIGTTLNVAAFGIYHAVWRRAPRALAYTVFVTAWIAYEYLYLNGELSFPWLVLGNGFAWSTPLVQWYEYTGTLGGSLWVLVANLLFFEAILRWRRWRAWVAPALWVLLPVALSLFLYGSYREPARTAQITLVQPNLEPYQTKFTMDHGQIRTLLLELMAQAPPEADFIVAPETVIPEQHLQEDMIELFPTVRAIEEQLRRQASGATALCGAITCRFYASSREASQTARRNNQGEYYDFFNSAVAIDSAGVVGIHHKSQLVSGAEKLPYYRLLKNLDFLIVDLGGISGQLGLDSIRKVFRSPRGISYGAAVCYESIYGEYFTEFVRNGAQVLFIITNDGWWRNTPGYRQHFAFARLRAIETRRPIARSANTGISGFIDARGDVSQTLGWDLRGTLTDRVAPDDRLTFYVRYGDFIGRLSSFLFGLCLLYFMAYRIRKKSHLVP